MLSLSLVFRCSKWQNCNPWSWIWPRWSSPWKSWLSVVSNLWMMVVLSERDYVTFGSLLSQIRLSSVLCLSFVCLSSVTFVHRTQQVEALGSIFSPLCTLAILWRPCKILRRSSQGNLSVGGVKRNGGSIIERCWTYRRLYLINGTRQTYSFY